MVEIEVVPSSSHKPTLISKWLKVNPHSLHLGRVFLAWLNAGKVEELNFEDVTGVEQTLDMDVCLL